MAPLYEVADTAVSAVALSFCRGRTKRHTLPPGPALDARYRRHVTTFGDDREQIRRLVDDWVIWRDTGQWERFSTV